MRNIIIDSIHKEAKNNKDIVLLTADLWYWVVDDFMKNLPKQCINVWIAEQNMIWIAAGLALEWKKVYCYSIIPFITMRCYEQIRVDICYQNLDVTLIWTWAWFAYGTMWPTHYWIEDINIMNWLPNMKILSIADTNDALNSTHYILNSKWPLYIRLNRWWETINANNNQTSLFEDIKTLSTWNDILIITTWNILEEVYKLSLILTKLWYSVETLNVRLLKPINNELLLKRIESKKYIFTIEEHSIIWWLWSIISDIVSESWKQNTFKKFWIKDEFTKYIWTQKYMRESNWLSGKELAKSILQILRK